MSKVEGELKIDELGQISICDQPVVAGSIIEIQINHKWVSVCIEIAHGTFYPIPQIDLKEGLTARSLE